MVPMQSQIPPAGGAPGAATAAPPSASVVRPPTRLPLDTSVRALGVVSLLNDISSEVTVRTLPLFLANVLGVKPSTIGLIEGLGESTATLLKLVSGSLTDRSGRRKPLALFGYALSGFSKPLLYFANGWGAVLVVRFLDRAGKGVRTPPRDALIADLVPAADRGRAFGFNKAMDKAGSVIGLLLAAGVLYAVQHGAAALTRHGYQSLVLLAVLPGVGSVWVLWRYVHEPVRASGKARAAAAGGRATTRAVAADRRATQSTSAPHAPASPLAEDGGLRGSDSAADTGFDPRFWHYLAILVCFSLGNSSDAFLMLRAQQLGLSTFAVFLVAALFSAVIAMTSTAGGAISDRFGRRRMMILGWLIYAAVYFGFAVAGRAWHAVVLYAAYGLYYGAFQGASTAMVADLVPAARRGRAFGLLNAAMGVAALPASVIAGALWQRFGSPAPFVFGGSLALIAAVWLARLPLPSRGRTA